MVLSIIGIFAGIFLLSNVFIHSELSFNIGYIVFTVSMTYLISFSLGTRYSIFGNIAGIIISGIIAFIFIFLMSASSVIGSVNLYSYLLKYGLTSWGISSIFGLISTILYNRLKG